MQLISTYRSAPPTGHTKVFLKASAEQALERARENVQREAVRVLGRVLARAVARRKFAKLKAAVVQLQCVARAKMARHALEELRKHKR